MKRKFSWVFCLLLTMCLVAHSSCKVMAGEINSAEASVISAASGTFTYQDATYKAHANYISQLSDYFAEDDVNLSDAEAKDLIASIHANIADGVASGYLYKVSDNKTQDDSTAEEDNSSKSKTNDVDEKKYDIKKAIKENKVFYVDKNSNETTSVDMVIKNTGFCVADSIYVMIGLISLMLGSIIVAVHFRLFAHNDES